MAQNQIDIVMRGGVIYMKSKLRHIIVKPLLRRYLSLFFKQINFAAGKNK
jgi:hypothetical protein